MNEAPNSPGQSLATLLELGHRVRQAESVPELEFVAVNDTHALAPYRQAALWLKDGGVRCLSGVVQVEANVPYVLWLKAIFGQLEKSAKAAGPVDAADFPGADGEAWAEWLPAHGLWLPLPGASASGGLLLARDLPWSEQEVSLLVEWIDLWTHAWRALQRPTVLSWATLKRRCRAMVQHPAGLHWWQWPLTRWSVVLIAVLFFPVRLTVLAPGELVPARPAVIRAPLEGVIASFEVQPNQSVKKGQPLFGFDEVLIQSRLEVTRQALATAETEYRQTAQQALTDSTYKAQLAVLTGKIEEKRAEAGFVADQLNRARVVAPQDGIALFDDPSEWIGRPVAVGERIMRIATPGDVEIEAWVPLADAIPLADDAEVSLYLSASPLSSVDARMRYLAHDAVERPDGTYAYRLRARLEDATTLRIGLKGTAKLQGGRVPLIYWILRRPLASIRLTLGW